MDVAGATMIMVMIIAGGMPVIAVMNMFSIMVMTGVLMVIIGASTLIA